MGARSSFVMEFQEIIRAVQLKATGATIHDVNNELACLEAAMELKEEHLANKHQMILIVWLSGRCKTIKEARRWYAEHEHDKPKAKSAAVKA